MRFHNIITQRMIRSIIKKDIMSYVFLVPLFSIIFFVCIIMFISFKDLHKKIDFQTHTLLYTDLPSLNQEVERQLDNHRQQLIIGIQKVKGFLYDPPAFQEFIKDFLSKNNEIIGVYRLKQNNRVEWSYPEQIPVEIDNLFNSKNDLPIAKIQDLANIFNPNHDVPIVKTQNIAQKKLKMKSFQYDILQFNNNNYIVLQLPLMYDDEEFAGSLTVLYAPDKLMSKFTHRNFLQKYAIQLIDQKKNIWYSSLPSTYVEKIKKKNHEIDLPVLNNQLSLVAKILDSKTNILDNMLMRIVTILAIVVLLSLVVLWWYIYRNMQSQKQLLSESAFRKSMGDSILVGMHAVNMQGKVTYVNPAFCKMTGFTELELLSTQAPFSYWSEQEIEPLKNTLSTDGLEIPLKRKNNDILYVRIHASKFMSGNAQQIGWLHSIVDVTALHYAQEKAKINEEKWHFANRVSNMGELASSLAHELNQPLTAINNYAYGILERIKKHQQEQQNISEKKSILVIPEDMQNYLGKISSQAIKAGDIIKRLRNFVSKSQPNKSLEDISKIAIEALDLISFSVKQTNSEIILDIEKKLPHILVDKILIEQVLVNLIKNAIEANASNKNNHNHIADIEFKSESKFEPEIETTAQTHIVHYVSVRIYTKHVFLINGTNISDENADKNKKHVMCIDVIDEGDGISPENQDKIFDAFFTTKKQGMGMGLNICRSIIENHNGALTVKNNSTKGCTFTISIPLNA